MLFFKRKYSNEVIHSSSYLDVYLKKKPSASSARNPLKTLHDS